MFTASMAPDGNDDGTHDGTRDGNDDPSPTRSATPSAISPTRTSEPIVPISPLAPTAPGAAAADPTAVSAARLQSSERYQIIGEHGRGGIGLVSRAHDRELGRDIAIKELISRGHVNELRFLREALITARLEHPGIVPIYEAGRWPDGTPFYAMKLVSGRSLRELLAQRTTADERIGLLHHVIAVADAIAYAHGRGIIHRDLKPANVIVGEFGETIVIDWGLAKDLATTDEPAIGGGPFRTNRDDGLTNTGSVLGTRAYMPPEQERGEHVDQRADVFAIGAMLWELCTVEKLPLRESLRRHRTLRRAGIDRDLATIIDKACDPDPSRRYPDAGALAADLKAFKAGARVASRRYSPWAMLAHWTRRHRTLALAAAVMITILAAGSVLYVRNVSSARDRADTALQVAKRDLDRAQLAEASLLVEKDPTSAKALLSSLTQRSAQYALLMARANQGAATHVIKLPGLLTKLLRHPVTSEIVVFAADGSLQSVDTEAGQLRALRNDLLGATAHYRDGWLYAGRSFGASNVTVASTSEAVHPIDAGVLLAGAADQLVTTGTHIYALDKHDLYELGGQTPALVERGVRSIGGNDHLMMVCTTANELKVTRDGIAEHTERCATNSSEGPLVASGAHYAALLDSDHLLLVRNGQRLELQTHISGEYKIALSSDGLLAMADLSDKTWFIRPGGSQLELGPAHASLPTIAAADDRFAAWGYADGVVIAVDTRTAKVWRFNERHARSGRVC